MMELPKELQEQFKDIFEHPLSGLAGMSDGSDTKSHLTWQLGAGETLSNPASKGRLMSGADIAVQQSWTEACDDMESTSMFGSDEDEQHKR